VIRSFVDKTYAWLLGRWPLVLLFVVLVFVLMRLHWGFRVLAAVVLVAFCLLAFTGAIFALIDLLQGGVDEPRFLVRLRSRAEQARERIKSLNTQRKGIQQKITQLDAIGKSADGDGTGKQWSKSMALLSGYREELALRDTKLEFYRKSLDTLTDLEAKWRQERRLKELQRDLDQLRRPNKQEAGQMKALRAELDFESKLLSTYQDLSRRIDRVDTVEGAQGLKRDLDELLR